MDMFSKSKTWSTLFTLSEEASLEMLINLRRVILNQSKGLKMIEDKCLYRNWTLTLPARILLLSSTNCGFLKMFYKAEFKHNIDVLLSPGSNETKQIKILFRKGFKLFNFLDVWDKKYLLWLGIHWRNGSCSSSLYHFTSENMFTLFT